jgi:hypothetical protein
MVSRSRVAALSLLLASGCGLTAYNTKLDTGPDGAVASCDPAPLSFGSLEVGGEPMQRAINIISVGSEKVALTDVRMTDDGNDVFSIVNVSDLPLPKSIPPGETFRFIVKFIPKEEQQYAGTITLVTDVAGEEATFTCAVEGAGCDPTAGSCP